MSVLPSSYNDVVYVIVTIGGQQYQGSGVLIAPDEVLTAAHVVYSQGVGAATSVSVTPGFNGKSGGFGTIAATAIHYIPVEDAGGMESLQQSQSDYAVIHLASAVTGAGTMTLQPGFSGGMATISGYPGIASGGQVSSTQSVSIDPRFSLIDFSALGMGSSGGPIWTSSANGSQVVGVVSSMSGTTGYGALITAPVASQINAWVSADHAAAPDYVAVNMSTVDVFRFFDTTDGGHFFTTSLSEKASLSNSASLKFEGAEFGAVNPAAGDATATPVYRFFEASAGGHFFTTSVAERDAVMASRPDMKYEGIAFNEHTTQQGTDVPVYRFFDKNDGGHFFTSSASEKASVLATNHSLTYEGIAFYAPQVG